MEQKMDQQKSTVSGHGQPDRPVRRNARWGLSPDTILESLQSGVIEVCWVDGKVLKGKLVGYDDGVFCVEPEGSDVMVIRRNAMKWWRRAKAAQHAAVKGG